MSESDEPKGGREPEASPAQSEEAAEPAPAPAPENRRARRAAAANAKKKRPSADRDRFGPRPGSLDSLDASERVDDALSRAADGTFRWIKDHFNVVQWLIVAGVGSWVALQIYTWRSDKTAAKVGLLLSEAVAADFGRVGSPDDEGKRDSRGSLDVRPVFSSDEERMKGAVEAYQSVVTSNPGSPSAGLAKLGLAGVLYDQAKYDDAKKTYEEVANGELAKLEPESKGRALEGVGLSLEAKGDKDGALAAFKSLENAEIPGFHELALYDQARVLHAKGDDESAKQRLTKVLEKVDKEPTSPTDSPNYLASSARELLQEIDPKAVPPSSNEALQKALSEFQKKLPPGVKRVPAPAMPESP